MMQPGIVANLSMLFTEHAFEERFEAAARAGFDAVEWWFPYDVPIKKLRELKAAAALPIIMINTPPGPDALGGKGLAAIPGQETAFRESLARAAEYAHELGVSYLHVMSGILPSGDSHIGGRETYTNNLRLAAEAVAPIGVTVLIEAINPVTTPRYFLNSLGMAHDILEELDNAGVAHLYDDFHARMIGEKIGAEAIGRHVRHVQLASAPARAEPDHAAEVVRMLKAAGYSGSISGEYQPAVDTLSGLAWIADARAALNGQ